MKLKSVEDLNIVEKNIGWCYIPGNINAHKIRSVSLEYFTNTHTSLFHLEECEM